jgi:glycine oxidase
MQMTTDVTLIGAGIIGLLTAKAFIQQGLSVTLIDQNSSSQEASWAGGGILLPLYPWRQSPAISQLVIPSIQRYPLLATQLQETTSIDPEWTNSGLLISDNPDYQQALIWGQKYGVDIQKADCRCNVPTNHPLWLPQIGQVRNPRLLKALRLFLQQKGVQLINNCSVDSLEVVNNKVQAIITTQGRLKVDQLVLTSGAWTTRLLSPLYHSESICPNIYPVKGQILVFQARADLLSRIILHQDRYLVPRRDGKILVGSSVENCGFDKTPTETMRTELIEFAIRILPELANYPVIHHWAGLRPGTRDGIPYIGFHPEIDNLMLNVGHFRNGLTMAPASAELLVALCLKLTTDLDAKWYSPA